MIIVVIVPMMMIIIIIIIIIIIVNNVHVEWCLPGVKVDSVAIVKRDCLQASILSKDTSSFSGALAFSSVSIL